MQPGVEVEISKSQKDELIISGNSLEGVSQSAADIQQSCKVRHKDIRKVGRRSRDSVPLVLRTARGSRRRRQWLTLGAVLGRYLRLGEGQHRRGVMDVRPWVSLCFMGLTGVARGHWHLHVL